MILPRLPSGEVKVVMTLDARLPAEPGPVGHRKPIAEDEHGRKLRSALPQRPILPCWSRRRRGGCWRD